MFFLKCYRSYLVRMRGTFDSCPRTQLAMSSLYKTVTAAKHILFLQLVFIFILLPRGLNSADDPGGWAMPTETSPLRVGIPVEPSFENFVKEVAPNKYEGFCIDIFNEAQEILSNRYSGLPYKFYPISASAKGQLDYDDMLNFVINKTYDMIAGDITILASRSELVDFTQPYTESGLSMILPAESEGSAWLFMKPFSWPMWIAIVSILIYTTFIIWFLEHRANPEFGGPRKSQLSTALWFSFSSLFFAHKEKISSDFAKIVVVVWLFLVFVVTSSYTASLSSMLTVQKMKAARDIEWVRQKNLTVGYDERSDFVRRYIKEEFRLNSEIVPLRGEEDYQQKLESKNISALFLELPYEKAFLAKYCKDYTKTTFAFRFGGLGFVFQKGSPLTKNFSDAILTLSESGALKRMQDKWFAPTKQCSTDSSDSSTDDSDESLTLQNFWGLFVISGSTSTLCLILSLFTKYRHHEETGEASDNIDAPTTDHDSMWKKALTITRSLGNGNFSVLDRAPTLRKWQSSRWERLRGSDHLQHNDHLHNEIQMA